MKNGKLTNSNTIRSTRTKKRNRCVVSYTPRLGKGSMNTIDFLKLKCLCTRKMLTNIQIIPQKSSQWLTGLLARYIYQHEVQTTTMMNETLFIILKIIKNRNIHPSE